MSGMSAASAPLVQIVKGELAAEELAALTAGRMTRAAAAVAAGAADAEAEPRFAHGNRHQRARWRRPERLATYRSPVSWR